MTNLQALQVSPVHVKDKVNQMQVHAIRTLQGCKPRYMAMGSWTPRKLRRK